jgi:hypothetical protein
MREKTRAEFIELLRSKLPHDIRIEEYKERNYEIIAQVAVFITSAGAFGALWKILEIWYLKKRSSQVKLSYKTKDGVSVEAEYLNLSKDEIEELITKYEPESKTPLKITLYE